MYAQIGLLTRFLAFLVHGTNRCRFLANLDAFVPAQILCGFPHTDLEIVRATSAGGAWSSDGWNLGHRTRPNPEATVTTR